jgi:hypothetical protein
MTAADFYIMTLKSRLHFLTEEMRKVGRFDDSFQALAAEKADVEAELEGLYDDLDRTTGGR